MAQETPKRSRRKAATEATTEEAPATATVSSLGDVTEVAPKEPTKTQLSNGTTKEDY